MSEPDQAPPRPSDDDQRRRGELVDKQLASGLTEAEAEELRSLEGAVDRYNAPIFAGRMEFLDRLEERMAGSTTPVPRGGKPEDDR